jgi:hypothetical protein
MNITDMPQQLDNKFPCLESQLADPKTVQDGLFIPHDANGALFVHVLQNHPFPHIDYYSFVPDLPYKKCFFFPPPFGPDKVPIHPNIFRRMFLHLVWVSIRGGCLVPRMPRLILVVYCINSLGCCLPKTCGYLNPGLSRGRFRTVGRSDDGRVGVRDLDAL